MVWSQAPLRQENYAFLSQDTRLIIADIFVTNCSGLLTGIRPCGEEKLTMWPTLNSTLRYWGNTSGQ